MAKLEFEDTGIEIVIKGDSDKVEMYGARLQGNPTVKESFTLQSIVDIAQKHPQLLEGKSGDIKDIFEGVAEIAPLFGGGLGGLAGILPIVDIVEKFIQRRKSRKGRGKLKKEDIIIYNPKDGVVTSGPGKGTIIRDYIIEYHEKINWDTLDQDRWLKGKWTQIRDMEPSFDAPSKIHGGMQWDEAPNFERGENVYALILFDVDGSYLEAAAASHGTNKDSDIVDAIEKGKAKYAMVVMLENEKTKKVLEVSSVGEV